MGKQGSQDLWLDLIKGDFRFKNEEIILFSGKGLIRFSMISLKFLKTCLEPLKAYKPYGL